MSGDIYEDGDPTESRVDESTRFVSALGRLISSEGWEILVNIIMKKIHDEEIQMDRPLSGQDGVLEQEYRKGSLHELRAILNTPQVLYDTAKEALDLLTPNEDDE